MLEKLIKKFGQTKLAVLVNVAPITIYRWRKAGIVPKKYNEVLKALLK